MDEWIHRAEIPIGFGYAIELIQDGEGQLAIRGIRRSGIFDSPQPKTPILPLDREEMEYLIDPAAEELRVAELWIRYDIEFAYFAINEGPVGWTQKGKFVAGIRDFLRDIPGSERETRAIADEIWARVGVRRPTASRVEDVGGRRLDPRAPLTRGTGGVEIRRNAPREDGTWGVATFKGSCYVDACAAYYRYLRKMGVEG